MKNLFTFFESPQHDGWNGDVGRMFNVGDCIIVSASTIQNDNFLLIRIGATQLRYQIYFINQFDFCIRHFYYLILLFATSTTLIIRKIHNFFKSPTKFFRFKSSLFSALNFFLTSLLHIYKELDIKFKFS